MSDADNRLTGKVYVSEDVDIGSVTVLPIDPQGKQIAVLTLPPGTTEAQAREACQYLDSTIRPWLESDDCILFISLVGGVQLQFHKLEHIAPPIAEAAPPTPQDTTDQD